MAENSSSESNEKMPVEEEVKEELEAEGEEAAEECDAEESEEEDGNDNSKKRTKRNIITAPVFKIKDEIEYRLDTNGNWRPTDESPTTESSNDTKPEGSVFQIITAPGKRCPSGQRQDSNGICRTVVPI
ncbi:hypothetical protein HZH66_009498 [Vespula vulgaris]|uniref:Uncharacterized protein n=1 Tax=Vespula vulgaris TaxID=7454 RepID=A0A834JLE7_VESVU|nr:hypothetical protein HZH66_009498 [Vespula vulgaris]